MTYSTQTTTKRRSDSARACLAALDLTQDGLVRPELRDAAILANHRQSTTRYRSGRRDSPRRPCTALC